LAYKVLHVSARAVAELVGSCSMICRVTAGGNDVMELEADIVGAGGDGEDAVTTAVEREANRKEAWLS